jgi:hypothetical protein
MPEDLCLCQLAHGFMGDNPTPDFAGSLADGFTGTAGNGLRGRRVAQCKRHDYSQMAAYTAISCGRFHENFPCNIREEFTTHTVGADVR